MYFLGFLLFVGALVFISVAPYLAILIFFFLYLYNSWYERKSTPRLKTYTRPAKYQENLSTNPFMSAKEKQAYMQSSKWKTLKSIKLSQTNHKCEHCGSKSNLQLHHNTYKRLGAEDIADLNILCGDRTEKGKLVKGCHSKVHEILGKDRVTDYPISILKD